MPGLAVAKGAVVRIPVVWRPQRPEAVTDLGGASAYCHTDVCRATLAGYGTLLAANRGAIPRKSALDLRLFRGAIANMSLLAISRPDRCIYRVAGEHVQQRFGTNPVGRNFYDLLPEGRRESAIRGFNAVIDKPYGYWAMFQETYDSGLIGQVEGVGVPFLSDEPGVDCFALIVSQEVGHEARLAPERRLRIGSDVRRRVLIDLGYGVDEQYVDMVPA
jgi:hypothetical protein